MPARSSATSSQTSLKNFVSIGLISRERSWSSAITSWASDRHSRISPRRTLREPIPEKWNDRCIEAVQDLRKGIARDDFDDADGLILSLPMEERDVRLVIAIILSLSTRYLSQFAPSSLP